MSVTETETETTPARTGGDDGGEGGTRNATGETPRPPRRGCLAALLRALPWSIGAAIGVAAGAYLTAVSGSGAPGTSGIEPTTDLVLLPAVAFAAMLVAHLLAQAASHAIRRVRR